MNIRRLIRLRERVRNIRDSKAAFSEEFFYWNHHNVKLTRFIADLFTRQAINETTNLRP